MITTIRPWGNSQGLYLPKKLLREMQLEVNDNVDMRVENGILMIRRDDSPNLKGEALESLKALRRDISERDTDYRKSYLEYLDERYNK